MEESLYNLAFERAILSSIIFEPTQFDDLENVLKVDDFYLPTHQDIYKAIQALVHRDEPIDEEFIKKELSQKKKFDEAVMLDILSANPISNTTAYIKEIKDKALKRHLLTLTTEIKRVTLEEELPSSEVVDIIEKKLYAITQDSQTSDFKDADRVTIDTMNYIAEMKARGNTVLVGVDTGFEELNKMTTGFGKGDLIILAARPAMRNVVLHGGAACFFSLEMPAEQLMLRLLSIKTSVGLQKLRVGDLNDDQWSRLNTAVDQMQHSKLFVDDHGSKASTLRSNSALWITFRS